MIGVRKKSHTWAVVRVFVVLWLLTACAAGNRPPEPVSTSSENLSEVLNRLDSRVFNGRNNSLNDLAPVSFARAEESLHDARDALQQGKAPFRVLEMIAAGNRHIARAEEAARLARSTMPGTIRAREQAREAGATKLGSDYMKAEEAFLSLTKAIENNDMEYVKINKAKVLTSFDRLELQAVKKQKLGEARRLISQCIEQGARKYAARTLENAQTKLREADEFISTHRYEKEEIQDISNEALFQAERLVEINRQVKKIQGMEAEQIGLWIEDILYRMAKALSAPDMRNKSFDIQVQNIVGSIKALQEDHQFVTGLGKARLAEIESLKKEIARLEGKTRQEQAVRKRLMAEKQFHALYNEVKAYFGPELAEVYKQDNRIIIRLKAIEFPVGRFQIMPDNYGLLTKVQRAIRTFGEPDVVIEGHTDSTGSEEVNEHLSRQRAEAVRHYLITNNILPAEKILAVGYGAKHPLASNESRQGRAINRRIDVVISPTSARLP